MPLRNGARTPSAVPVAPVLFHQLGVIWCRITGRRQGRVGYILHSGPFWMCDRCGTVVRCL